MGVKYNRDLRIDGEKGVLSGLKHIIST